MWQSEDKDKICQEAINACQGRMVHILIGDCKVGSQVFLLFISFLPFSCHVYHSSFMSVSINGPLRIMHRLRESRVNAYWRIIPFWWRFQWSAWKDSTQSETLWIVSCLGGAMSPYNASGSHNKHRLWMAWQTKKSSSSLAKATTLPTTMKESAWQHILNPMWCFSCWPSGYTQHWWVFSIV
jgi:hypothetical protein